MQFLFMTAARNVLEEEDSITKTLNIKVFEKPIPEVYEDRMLLKVRINISLLLFACLFNVFYVESKQAYCDIHKKFYLTSSNAGKI